MRPLRAIALKKAEKWILERVEMSDGLGAIYPGHFEYRDLALRCLGYSIDDPQMIRALDEFEKLGIEDAGIPGKTEPTFRMQPCISPVWDTAYAVFALGQSGVSQSDPRLLQAADWMLSKEVRHKGDWAVKVPNVEPGGWYFEFNNEFYPDIDDSAQVLLALNKVDNHAGSDISTTFDSARHCLDLGHAMQERRLGQLRQRQHQDGVSSTFPFADHNAMLDPPTVDITGRILEMLANYGITREDRRVAKAIQLHL